MFGNAAQPDGRIAAKRPIDGHMKIGPRQPDIGQFAIGQFAKSIEGTAVFP